MHDIHCLTEYGQKKKLRSDADDRASVYAGYQRRGKNYGGADQSGNHF